MTANDLRICFLGDSFTQGVGDLDGGGWVRRLAVESRRRGHRLTAYNLGVQGQTSQAVADRWQAETSVRFAKGDVFGVVVAVGANDVRETGLPHRLSLRQSLAAFTAVLDGVRDANRPCLVVGPPPASPDGATDAELRALDGAFAALCAGRGVVFISLQESLRTSAEWWKSVEAYGDGAHCDGDGYQLLAELIGDGWWKWLESIDRPA